MIDTNASISFAAMSMNRLYRNVKFACIPLFHLCKRFDEVPEVVLPIA